MTPGNDTRRRKGKNKQKMALIGMFLAPNQGIFILITALLEHGNTKNSLILRFAEFYFLVNAPYLLAAS